ncbi:MAG: MaoC/PaaZ C-terminal domain-containing protein [bacterium]
MEFFEDFQVGQIIPLGSYRMEEAEMLEFARQYDPQPFHVDPAAARDSIYGQLIASGLHTLAVFCKIWVDVMPRLRGQGSPGWDEIRWRKPVLAVDELSGEAEVVVHLPSGSALQPTFPF